MNTRAITIAAAACLLLLAGFAALPWAVDRYATAKVDKALDDVRVRSTAVVTRGAVSVDIGGRSVAVRDVAVDTPGENGARLRIALVTIERPSESGGRITAAKVRFDDVVMSLGRETVRVPSVTLTGYAGPPQGLVTATGSGVVARTQAEIAAGVWADGATIPLIEIDNDKAGVRRRVTDVVFGPTEAGVAQRVDVGGASARAPARLFSTRGGLDFEASTGAMSFEGLSVPALLRFLAGDGQGKREAAIAKASIERIAFSAPTATMGLVKGAIGRLEIDDLRLRALAAPGETLELLQSKAESGEPLTPAETRRKITLMTDATRAVAFARVGAFDASLDAERPASTPLTLAAERVVFAGYADAALERVVTMGARIAWDGRSATIGEAYVDQIDAANLLAHAERVGRDEILLTTTPAPDEMLGLVPRARRAGVSGVELLTRRHGVVRVGMIRTGARGENDTVPNRIGLRVEDFEAAAPTDRWYSKYLADAGVERLDLDFRVLLSLDPTTQILKLDGLDYSSPEIADLHLEGELAQVDPTLAVATGAEFVDKLSRVTLQPFTLRLTDKGGIAGALASAAKAQGTDPTAYRNVFAQEAKQRMEAVLGPSAEASATATELFLRTGGTLEARIVPRSPDTTLLRLLGLIRLGPEGVAQALDVSVLSRAL
ncbi:hypothetical protein ACFSCV_00655 [Methylopila henanensis]|uniref:DUF748 domain-containing protein n=1 Tax=Methylopila henanensis TaxID=873516 RepID=A0ABW4K204_9HYPH